MYGFVELNKNFSTGQWLKLAIKIIKEIQDIGFHLGISDWNLLEKENTNAIKLREARHRKSKEKLTEETIINTIRYIV